MRPPSRTWVVKYRQHLLHLLGAEEKMAVRLEGRVGVSTAQTAYRHTPCGHALYARPRALCGQDCVDVAASELAGSSISNILCGARAASWEGMRWLWRAVTPGWVDLEHFLCSLYLPVESSSRGSRSAVL